MQVTITLDLDTPRDFAALSALMRAAKDLPVKQTKSTSEDDTKALAAVAFDPTVEGVRAALKHVADTKGVDVGLKILAKYGASRVSELAMEKYQAFVNECAQ